MATRLIRPLTGALAAALVLTACSAGSSTNPPPDDDEGSGPTDEAPDEALVVGLVAEPASLDFTTTDGAAIPQALLVNVYEGLVELDQDGEIAPALAEEWDISDDGLTYTFTLVEGATFTNGDEFDADDAVFSIERVKSDDWVPTIKAGMDVVDTAEATSPTELVVTLAQPSNDWLFRMTTRIGAMFSETGVDDLATTTVGTGPYTLDTWNRGDSIVLTRNADYWGEEPYFGEITLQYFDDGNALNNALLTDTIDVIGTVQAPESLAQFEGEEGLQIIEGTTNGEVVLSFNHRQPALQDPQVRQAIRQAIDKQALVDTCWAGYGELIGSHVPPTDPWYEDLTDIAPYDPDEARSLLEAAGASDLTLRLRLPTLPYATSCGQSVASQLEEVGITVESDQLEFPAQWLQQVFTDYDYDMSMVAHVEPRDVQALFGNPDYYLGYDSPDVQAALAEADAGTPEEQVTLMQEVARMISEDAAADWLFLLPNLIVAEDDITGLPENAIGESFDLTRLARS
jgi:peptide/nickel transport system substrate-binding protein